MRVGKDSPPDPPLDHAWIVPGGDYYAQWLWDTMFVADLLSLLPGQVDLIRGVFRNYWDFQQRWNVVKPEFGTVISHPVAVFHRSGKDVDDGFDAAMRMPWEARQIVRWNVVAEDGDIQSRTSTISFG